MMKKKLMFFIAVFVMSLCLAPNVFAEDISVSPSDSLKDKIANAAAGDTLILADGTYTGDITIDKALTIKGTSKDATIIDGQVNVASNGAVVNLETLTITKKGMDSAGVKLTGTSNVVITDALIQYANIVGDNYGNSDYFTGIWLTKTADGSTLALNNSEVRAKYGIWVHGQSNEVTVTDSILTGWAPLDISNGNTADTLALGNSVSINGSTLTGAAVSGPTNAYGTVVIGGQDGLNLTVNNSTITNKFTSQNTQDLILYADAYLASQNVSIEIIASKLINTDTTDDSSVVRYGTAEVSANDNTLVMIDTTIDSENGQVYATPTGYVTLTVDILGVTSTMTIPAGSALTAEEVEMLKNLDLESLGLTGYELVGYYADADFTKEFDFEQTFDADTTMYVKVQEKAEEVPTEPVETPEDPEADVENPDTSDMNVIAVGAMMVVAIVGLGYTVKKRKFN